MGAAMAIHAVRNLSAPVLLHLDIVGTGTISIDPRFNAYDGAIGTESFPAHPGTVLVQTQPMPLDAPPQFELPGRDLDGLLWMIGAHAFGDRPASWLAPNARYRLTRWPNLSALPIGIDEVRMLATLAHAHASPAELAASAGCELSTAQRLVNALSVIGILDASSEAPTPQRVPVRTNQRGLFRRLRERLGF